MSKVKSLKKALAKVTRSVEKANKSSKGKESKLEEAVKQIEDMSKKPAFVRLRQMANKNRKRKGLPLKPELSDIPEARQKMMTPAQKRRARKTQKDLGPSARRDMKDAKPPIEKSEGGMATSRSRKPRGVGVALRGYGKALK